MAALELRPKASPTRPGMALGDELAIVVGDDAGRFLAAMLKGMQPQHAQGAGIGMAENAENAAFFMQRIRSPRYGLSESPGRSWLAASAVPCRLDEAV